MTPALRHLFMGPKNALRMRDGVISLLAGNLRGNWNAILPVLAFKAVYHAVALGMRLGWHSKPPTAPSQLAAAE